MNNHSHLVIKPNIVLCLLAMASLACAKEFKIEVQFSPMFWLSGKRHNDTMTFRHDGRRIICHYRPLTIQERKWIADNVINSYPAMYSESAYIDGIGKILMLACEEIHANNETCVRGIVYLVHDNGKWEQGVFSQRTLGWGDSDSKIWGGYAFVHAKEENIKKQENKTMSEPKFTKGPWSIWTSHHEIADTGDYYDEIGVKDKNGHQLCVMCGDLDDDIMQANAVLIAQCPRMYKSLKENMNFLRNLAGWLGTTPDMKDSAFVDAMFKQADDIEKLLKQARGER